MLGDTVARNPRELARLLRYAKIAMDKSTIDVLIIYTSISNQISYHINVSAYVFKCI